MSLVLADQRAARRVNISDRMTEAAAGMGAQRAVVMPGPRDRSGRRAYRHLTFKQLASVTDRMAHGLRALGIGRGDRTVLMVRPSLEFVPLTFALFKIGAVPVLIDPGMGRQHLLKAIEEVQAQAFIGISAAHAARTIFPRAFRSIRHHVTVGRRWWWGGATLDRILRDAPDAPAEAAPTEADETAAILFTTGSTGAPKGVVYTHGVFDNQVRIIREHFGVKAGDIDMPVFPLFALFSTALGATVVLPDMDPTRPAQADPRKILETIEDQGITYSFGSPTFWRTVAQYCIAQGVRLPTLQRVFMAGAPVPPELVDQMAQVMPEGEVFIPYGATESLPVSFIQGEQIRGGLGQRARAGAGTCVGRPVPGNEVRIIEIDDGPITSLSQTRPTPTGEVGEIIVRGSIVTRSYLHRPAETVLAKIEDGDRIWHRMGDVGYLDTEGRLWFCGRKAHRVESADGPMFTVRCEAIFNEHPSVYRSALVGIDGEPVLVVECLPSAVPHGDDEEQRLREALLALGARSGLTRNIQEVLFHPNFPVDIRHNAKIFREQLALWARKALNR